MTRHNEVAPRYRRGRRSVSTTLALRVHKEVEASLDVSADKDIEIAWQVEIDKRLREIDTGTVTCIV